MPKIKDLTGQRFGRLTVKGFSQKDRHNKGHWVCLCDCGNVVDVETHQLKSGKTKSCGCLKSEKTRERVKTHGDTGSRLYWVWAAIIQRCTNPANAAYNNYGGRGLPSVRNGLRVSSRSEIGHFPTATGKGRQSTGRTTTGIIARITAAGQIARPKTTTSGTQNKLNLGANATA